ncbi:MAG: peroxiredoxin [Elusimicrobia bacterium]|nr:peroxiredoxin [Elusimicrobiota bacterium]
MRPSLALSLLLALPAFAAERAGVPKIGADAPGFTLKSQDGKEVSLTDFRGKWVVLYFYPKDMTPGCTIEAHNFQRDLKKFESRKAVILGVSLDTPDSHKEFCSKEGLSFKLLSDVGGDVSKAYGSMSGVGALAYSARNTFLIGPDGDIKKVYVGVSPSKHSEEVLGALAELQKPKKG